MKTTEKGTWAMKIPEYEKWLVYEVTNLLSTFVVRFDIYTDEQIEYICEDLHEFFETERAQQAAIGQFLAALTAIRAA
jgi:hypothetical protein